MSHGVMLEFSSCLEYISAQSSNVVFILKLLLKISKCWRKGFFLVWLDFLMPVFILLYKLLKTSMHEPILTPLCSDKILHVTHLLQPVNFLPNYVFQKIF